MPWPVPAPGVIASRAAAIYEGMPALQGIDARSDNTVAAANTRITEMACQDLYIEQAYLATEQMPDTAVENLPRFGTIWGVPQDQPSYAAGNVFFTGGNGVVVPEGVQLQGNSTQIYVTTGSGTIENNSVSLPAQASVAGVAGNLAAGAPLTVISNPGLNINTVATVDSNGLTGGADLESVDSWRARILAQIREEPSGGSYADYESWAKAALPNVALASCPPAACGGGVVSVAIAMTGFVPPTTQQIAEVLAYIQTKRPVGATQITVYACVLNPVNVTLHLNPDTVTIRAAASAALALSFAQDAAIGGTTYMTRLDAAVSSSDGEYSHERSQPSADVPAPTLFSLNVLGTVSFV